MDCRQQIEELQRANEQLQATIEQLQSDKTDLNRTLKQSEQERLLLLKSRGITPKSMPQWALQEAPRKGVSEPLKRLRIWTGTWNVSGKEPFSGMEKERAKRLLQPFVPAGYDIYALSVQDCVSESIFECFDALQASEGCRRLRLMNASGTPVTNDDGTDPSRLYGRGDGTLKSLKFTGLVIYVRAPLVGDVKMLNMINFPLSSTHSRGAVAAVVNALGRNVVFVSTQLDPKNNDTRRDQYQTLFTALGSNLAEADFHLNDQFHHVVWMGDFGYSLVDTSGNRMPPESATHMLSDGRLLRTLFETHDQLNQDKRNQLVFFGYREPIPYPNFYPTYKKVENRPPANYTSNDWVRNVYVTRVKDPFYYGGKVREWTPSFPDRGTGNGRVGGGNAGAKTVQSLLTVLANHENTLDGSNSGRFDAPPEPVRLADAFPTSPEAPPSAPLTGAPPPHSHQHHHTTGIPATPLRQSLLPHGIYRIRLSDMRMIWGVNEESPRHVGLLFPAPPAKGNPAMDSLLAAASLGWRKSGSSNTGTCVRLESAAISPTGGVATVTGAKTIPPVILTWRGDEPLDRLHICIKNTAADASMTSKAISAPSLSSSSSGTASKRQSLSRTPPPNGGGGGGGGGAGGSMDGDEDRITGHCVISLEQLCKVALSGSISSEGAIAATTVARLLVNKGRPMYNIDTKAMQREMVTFCCKLELLQN
eukprot:gene10291-7309_t